MAMRAPQYDEALPKKLEPGARTKDDPAWQAFMNAPPLSRPLTDDEKKAIEDWKARRAAKV